MLGVTLNATVELSIVESQRLLRQSQESGRLRRARLVHLSEQKQVSDEIGRDHLNHLRCILFIVPGCAD